MALIAPKKITGLQLRVDFIYDKKHIETIFNVVLNPVLHSVLNPAFNLELARLSRAKTSYFIIRRLNPMPYTKTHKNKTRERILDSSFRLFAIKGFEGVTIDDLMKNCGLTRGGFYAHFTSKAELYSESLKFRASNTKLADFKPEGTSNKQWLSLLLNKYLSLEHVNGERSLSCPLAFLASDINMQDKAIKTAYADVYYDMNTAIMEYATSYTDCDEQDILSVTAMMIGAVAIARTLQNQDSIENLLAACRREAGVKLGGI